MLCAIANTDPSCDCVLYGADACCTSLALLSLNTRWCQVEDWRGLVSFLEGLWLEGRQECMLLRVALVKA